MKMIVGLFSCLSRAINVLRRGHPDMTLSAAAYMEDLRIRRYIDAVFRLFGEEDHCEKWYWEDVRLAREVVERHTKALEN